MEHEGDNYTNRDWGFRYSHQRIIKGTGGLGGRRTNGDHPNNNIIENARILRRVLETCCYLNSSERPSAKTDGKNFQGVNNNNNNNNNNKLWNMNVTVIPIVVGALGTLPKDLEKKIGGIGNWRKS